MRTYLLSIVALSLVCSCASAPKKPVGQYRAALKLDPWEDISEQCKLNRETMTVSCTLPWFENQVLQSIDIHESALHYATEHDRMAKLVGVDRRQCESEKNNLVNKLNSPWRSPWLWSAIGLVGGMAITASLIAAIP